MTGLTFGICRISIPVLLLCFACTGGTTDSSASATGTPIHGVVEPRVEAFLQEMLDEERISGVVLIAKDRKVVHAKGYGVSVGSARNNVNTDFHVASVTKQFTAATIMQLDELNARNSKIESFLRIVQFERFHADPRIRQLMQQAAIS